MKYRHHHGAMNVACFTSPQEADQLKSTTTFYWEATHSLQGAPHAHTYIRTSVCLMSCLHCRKAVLHQCTQSRKLTTLQETDTHKRQLWNPFLFQAEGPSDKSCSVWQNTQGRACRLHPLAQKSSLRWQGGYSGTGSHWDRKHTAHWFVNVR